MDNNDKLNALKPKHGKSFTIGDKPSIKSLEDASIKIDEAVYLISLIAIGGLFTRKLNVPCSACFRNAALRLIDAGNLLNEIADKYEKK